MQVAIEVKITAGTPLRKAVIHEVATSNATWVIFDRYKLLLIFAKYMEDFSLICHFSIF